MPVLLEEEFMATKNFVESNPEVNVIIPHMGELNGGYERMRIFYQKENVYFDTSVAPLKVIREVLEHVGPERVIFGSDVSGTSELFYNFPKIELQKIYRLNLDEEDLELILAGNIERIIAKG